MEVTSKSYTDLPAVAALPPPNRARTDSCIDDRRAAARGAGAAAASRLPVKKAERLAVDFGADVGRARSLAAHTQVCEDME